MKISDYFPNGYMSLMNFRTKIHESFIESCKYLIHGTKTLFLFFILLTFFNSCEEDENMTITQAYVIDAISHEKLVNTEGQLLEWRESWFSGSL